MAVDPKNRVKGDTSKSKASLAPDLGIPLSILEEQSILWVPVAMDTKTKHLLADVCEARDLGKDATAPTTKGFAVVAKLAQEAIEANRAAWEKEASVIVRKMAEEQSEEDLQKAIAAQQRKLEALKAAMDAKLEALKAAKK